MDIAFGSEPNLHRQTVSIIYRLFFRQAQFQCPRSGNAVYLQLSKKHGLFVLSGAGQTPYRAGKERFSCRKYSLRQEQSTQQRQTQAQGQQKQALPPI